MVDSISQGEMPGIDVDEDSFEVKTEPQSPSEPSESTTAEQTETARGRTLSYHQREHSKEMEEAFRYPFQPSITLSDLEPATSQP